jgi:hypothetical protein
MQTDCQYFVLPLVVGLSAPRSRLGKQCTKQNTKITATLIFETLVRNKLMKTNRNIKYFYII